MNTMNPSRAKNKCSPLFGGPITQVLSSLSPHTGAAVCPIYGGHNKYLVGPMVHTKTDIFTYFY